MMRWTVLLSTPEHTLITAMQSEMHLPRLQLLKLKYISQISIKEKSSDILQLQLRFVPDRLAGLGLQGYLLAIDAIENQLSR